MGVDEMGVDEMRVDEMGVDEMGSKRSGNKPPDCVFSLLNTQTYRQIVSLGPQLA